MIFDSLRALVLRARSYRSFDPSRPIEEDVMTELVDTARLSSSAGNLQPLKYRLCTERDEVEGMTSLTKWAAYLKDVTLPPDGHHPTGYIVICHDTSISPVTPMSTVDVGIAAEAIALGAAEMGYGGCMIGSFDKSGVAAFLSIPKNLTPVLVMALGTPDESVLISKISHGDIKYFRDDAGLHFVPKRDLEDVIVR
ncbi:MAG: nitroreductase family protein [Clostridia bacterium]|nr:nitroreductase family protein [Clostridia bacterium]